MVVLCHFVLQLHASAKFKRIWHTGGRCAWRHDGWRGDTNPDTNVDEWWRMSATIGIVETVKIWMLADSDGEWRTKRATSHMRYQVRHYYANHHANPGDRARTTANGRAVEILNFPA
jgi:hypothetical protein